jgi:large subunit ribosomal protein L3
MVDGLLGKKVGMTQVLAENGLAVPVTVVQAGPCVVVQRKTVEKDGYDAVQLGLVEFVKEKNVTKPIKGHLKKADAPPLRFLREVRVRKAGEGSDEVKAGDRIQVGIFRPDERVTVVGTSKGRGFAGVIKRHGFGGGRATHGSMFHRAPGSIGQSAYPSRVLKGTRMPGQMGNSRITVRGVHVFGVDEERNLLLLRGAVPGPNGGYVVIRKGQR